MDTLVSLKNIDDVIGNLKPYDHFYITDLMYGIVEPIFFKDSEREYWKVSFRYARSIKLPNVIDGENDYKSVWEVRIKHQFGNDLFGFTFLIDTNQNSTPGKVDVALAFQNKVNSMAVSMIQNGSTSA